MLVKAPKPGQDRRIDLPTIGPQTIAGAARAGLAGIAVVAGEVIMAEPERVAHGRRSRADIHRRDAAGSRRRKTAGRMMRPLPARDRELAIVLVAGEESGDQLGAPLMRALKERTGGRVRFAGVGGREMAAEGLVSLFPIEDLAIIGFAAIPRRLPLILRRIRETAALVVAAQPDALVIIDSPDFTHRVARRVRAAAPAIPILDYVSPSVWAWRPGRARAMRGYVDHVLALLPFEPAAHARLGGPPCTYVGHPLLERLAQLRPSAEEARRRLAEPPVVLVLPGSRGGEIRRLLAIFGAGLGAARGRRRSRPSSCCPRSRTCASGSRRPPPTGRCGRASWSIRRTSRRPSASPARRSPNPAPSRSSLRSPASRWWPPTRSR